MLEIAPKSIPTQIATAPQTVNCPVCNEAGCSKTSATKADPFGSARAYDCPRCGRFILSDFLKDGALVDLVDKQRAVLSHRLRHMQRVDRPPPLIDTSNFPKADDPLPSPAQQVDSLILWIGDHQPSPAEPARTSVPEISAWIGAAFKPINLPNDALTWLLNEKGVDSVVKSRNSGFLKPLELQLTMAGWQRYEALKHAQVESRTAFMAMKFGEDELNQVVNDWFKPAVKAADFELRILTDGLPAGLIDDQMRVALRTARFVIADLTHGSHGAYWEAGFAEGLGRPVIYTCRKDKWQSGEPHFDTNHLNTIVWDPENLQDAATRLAAMIRATLPAEAKMMD